MKQLFYKFDLDNDNLLRNDLLDDKYSPVLWKPSILKIIPAEVKWLPFAVWWLMHYLHIFANKDYGIYLIYHDHNLVHRSVITPRYFRFPFMGKEDLQIGDTWTMPRYRGKALANFAIHNIVKLHKKPGRRFWYVVEKDNIPSIRAVEKAGFVKYGAGVRKKRMGISLLGFFEIEKNI